MIHSDDVQGEEGKGKGNVFPVFVWNGVVGNCLIQEEVTEWLENY